MQEVHRSKSFQENQRVLILVDTGRVSGSFLGREGSRVTGARKERKYSRRGHLWNLKVVQTVETESRILFTDSALVENTDSV